RPDHDLDLVAGLQRARLPTALVELQRRAHLDAPILGAFLAGHRKLDPTVRIRELEQFDGADERDGLFVVKHRAGVMREARCGPNCARRSDCDDSLHPREPLRRSASQGALSAQSKRFTLARDPRTTSSRCHGKHRGTTSVRAIVDGRRFDTSLRGAIAACRLYSHPRSQKKMSTTKL